LLKADSSSWAKRTLIPVEKGQGFLRKTDSRAGSKRTVIPAENGQLGFANKPSFIFH